MISKAALEAKMAEYPTESDERGRFRDEDGRIDPFFDEEEDESEWPDVDLGGFPRGLELVRVCLRVVWKDKEIFFFQALAAGLCLVVLFLFFPPSSPVSTPRPLMKKGSSSFS
ncbi:MAG: hypothetical protein QXU73_07245 [Thermoplasmata archaeon]